MHRHPYAALKALFLQCRPNHHRGELEGNVISAALVAYGATALTSKIDALKDRFVWQRRLCCSHA